ncbi:MAG TPA: bifunctional serine/threonine-protein kinase/formylglycine-generating enzyme family protein [Phycisphaerae bacterium]|nr:bifunctional serine/threonine-protein kinase/formylglycine-generating enzyme family protein [Phycisphaerae bacterium]
MSIFDRVCDLPQAEQAAALAAACDGNEPLRARVEQMLAAETDAGAPFADSRHGAGAFMLSDGLSASEESVAPPHEIGGYRIHRELGRGGMGIVYEAEQENPRRRVALKVIRQTLASGDLVTRFRREAHVLGQLRHPGIAHVIEAGTTRIGESDLPYYTMELVDGVPLDQYADSLPLRDRVELMARVCDAVQHAHQRGVIHRDLKPANILVVTHDTAFGASGVQDSIQSTLVDAIGRPKILDFGVARLIDTDIQLTTLQTNAGQIVGTLGYMSPEQLDTDTSEIDTRCDVYALGVLAYRIFSGRLPYDLSGKHIAEAVRLIRESEPPRLSSIDVSLRGDLDTIVTKSIEKDPNRRYATAAALAEDLRRFLASEPITAHPPSAFYQVRKFAGRNKALVGGILATTLAIAVGAVLAGYFAVNEFRQRRVAETQKQIADRRYDEVIRLSDLKRLNDAIEKADELWPELPVTIPALEQWISEYAAPLEANLDLHKRTLEELRAQATPTRNETGEIVGWKLADHDLQWRHDMLSDLVTRLENFCHAKYGARLRVMATLENARMLRLATLESPGVKRAWEQTVQIARELPVYRGLRLKPQAGLCPIGVNKQSGLLEFLHLRSGRPPETPFGAVRPLIKPETGVVMVLLPGGSVTLGCQNDDPDAPRYDPETGHEDGPVHTVELAPFIISKFEITQGQWRRLTGQPIAAYAQDPGENAEYLDTHPAEQVNWPDAMKFLPRHGLALPTEAQWEYAARAGTETPWSSGATAESLKGYANIADRTLEKFQPEEFRTETWIEDGYFYHAPVGSFEPNAFGLFDMMGNVQEWCRDRYAPYTNAVSGPDALRNEWGNARAIARGGSWMHPARAARSAARDHHPPDVRFWYLGVRPIWGGELTESEATSEPSGDDS